MINVIRKLLCHSSISGIYLFPWILSRVEYKDTEEDVPYVLIWPLERLTALNCVFCLHPRDRSLVPTLATPQWSKCAAGMTQNLFLSPFCLI